MSLTKYQITAIGKTRPDEQIIKIIAVEITYVVAVVGELGQSRVQLLRTSLYLGVDFRIVYGIVLAVAGMLGDLAESLLKRETERKDSSNWLPGLGGVGTKFKELTATGRQQ